jgi:DNA-binding CsgD family transcriptional regulator
VSAAEGGRRSGLASLTPKERECLRLVLENRSSKDIARRLGILHTSVDTHVRRARAKLGVRDRYAAARLLEQWERKNGAPTAIVPPTVPPPPPLEPPRPSDARVDLGGIIPPLETLGVQARIALVVLTATFMALIFGIVLNAMRTL